MIPKEVREFIVKLVDDRVNKAKEEMTKKFNDIDITTEELNEEIDAIKVDISILKDGGNI